MENSDNESSTNESATKFPVTLLLHGYNLYSGILYDVDGNILRAENGRPYNVFQVKFKEAMGSKDLRLIHVLNPGYRFFVTSESQLRQFYDERENGSLYQKTTYHVYDDEDFDFTSSRLKNIIIRFAKRPKHS